MKTLYLILILSIFSLTVFSSCNKKVVRDNPRDQYRQCLRENPDNPDKCEVYRDSYQERFESHRDAYRRGVGDDEY